MNNESSREIQIVITFHSNVRLRHIIYETLEIEHEIGRKIQMAITLDSGV